MRRGHYIQQHAPTMHAAGRLAEEPLPRRHSALYRLLHAAWHVHVQVHVAIRERHSMEGHASTLLHY